MKTRVEELRTRLLSQVSQIYSDQDKESLVAKLMQVMKLESDCASPEQFQNHWNEADIATITYGNTFLKNDDAPLQTLCDFLTNHLHPEINIVHILPFFPFSSDDGFAVMDYTQVNETYGNWDDVSEIANHFKLMSDLVINHCSGRSRWFDQLKTGKSPGKDYFVK
ncbi:MAG: alpha-amylase family glycosyl hydrolase, partial [Pseudomonadota bacterium]